jgi:D-alanyl-D-alanine dipeptidase
MKRIFLLCCFVASSALAQNFVEIRTIDPTIAVEARYATSHNFIGPADHRVSRGEVLPTPEAAPALGKVQAGAARVRDVAQGVRLLSPAARGE